MENLLVSNTKMIIILWRPFVGSYGRRGNGGGGGGPSLMDLDQPGQHNFSSDLIGIP